jgi:hypothetical protein
MSADQITTRLTSDQLRERVISNTGEDGRLKDRTFDLDARAVAILSKRHQISVRIIHIPRHLTLTIY